MTTQENNSHPCQGGCGRQVSASRTHCLACVEHEARVEVTRKEEPLKETTHVLLVHHTMDSEDLYRADGLLVASRQKDLVRFGSDISTAQNRPLLNSDLAKAWLRKLAEVDVVAARESLPIHQVVDRYPSINEEVVIEERDIETRVIQPSPRRVF